ncbi:MAG TPA: histidine phosphatase family protein [Terriglobales bacterium]|nr:histidine phosphatase family protein [Terriglobales bacterium]
MTEIVLIRHAETDLAGKFCGHSDPDLNAAGLHRLRSIMEEVAPLGITRIYSSDLRRASRTATTISERIGAPVEFRSGFREIHFGRWEGLTWDQVQRSYPTEAELWVRDFPARSAPEGEAYRDFTARVEAEFRRVIAQHKNTPLAVVTHSGVMQCALTRFFGFTRDEARKETENYGAIVVVTPQDLREIDSMGIRA